MIVNPVFLGLAICLLWLPRQWLRLGIGTSRKSPRAAKSPVADPWNAREPGDPSVSFAVEFRNLRNYVDLFRAAMGSLALFGAAYIPSVLAVPEEHPSVPPLAL